VAGTNGCGKPSARLAKKTFILPKMFFRRGISSSMRNEKNSAFEKVYKIIM
jgi:hypothetical protein